MTPERWQQISRIFKSAISLDGEARRAFVADQCGADEHLRSEVEKLIASHRQAKEDEFIAGRAADDGAVLLIEEEEAHEPRLNQGQQVGSYVILDRLGIGGMGEVYLARDTRLERTIALKVVSPDISADKRRMQRFRQEARVVSTLNQPNILTVYEFDEVEGLTFLATEFIDGETLRDYLHQRKPKLVETIGIAIQVLTALDAAHEARIVHRDIKPENVMIRHRDQLVKVLDFGLAKVTEKRSGTAGGRDSDLEAVTEFKTTPGVLMGTINYMSPEQARALPVDERSDIWSVGVLLFEMVTGVMPFAGPTTSHTLVQIIEKDPPALTKIKEAPAELQRIIRKAMAKNPEERFQSARDMVVDLRNLQRQLELGEVAAPETSSASERNSRQKRVLLIALAAMLLATAAIFAYSFWRAGRARSAVAIPAASPITPVSRQHLTYWITVQKKREGKYQEPFTVAGEINFEAGDEIRVNLRTPQAGHLYVLNEGPRTGAGAAEGGTAVPEFVILFPSPTANEGSSRLAADEQIQIPEKTWLRFDREAGVERLWLVFGEDTVPELESVKEFASRETGGLVTDMAQNKAIQELLNGSSPDKPSAAKGDTLTTLTTTGKLLVYPVRLEHH